MTYIICRVDSAATNPLTASTRTRANSANPGAVVFREAGLSGLRKLGTPSDQRGPCALFDRQAG